MFLDITENFIKETNAEIKKYEKNSLIINEGSTSLYFYYLLEGELSVYNLTPEGKEFLQHKVRENNFLANQPFC